MTFSPEERGMYVATCVAGQKSQLVLAIFFSCIYKINDNGGGGGASYLFVPF